MKTGSMHYAATESNDRVPKFLKVKAQFWLNFDPNLKNPLLAGQQLLRY